MKRVYTDNEIKERLKELLPPKRYIHIIGVSETAVNMAKQFGADPKKAYTAGLLHDCVKYMSDEELLKKCKELGVELDQNDMQCLPVIHAPLGAVVARKEYGIEDIEILDAIRYHTTGRAKMTKLDKIIYTADMIEPSREFDGVEALREMAKEDLDKAVLACVDKTVIFNIKKGKTVHPKSIECRNDLICERSNDK